jgi:hypothetical protein
MLYFSVSIRGRGHQLDSTKRTFIRPVHSLPRPDIPSHMVTWPLKSGSFVAYCQWRTFYRSHCTTLALLKCLLTVRLLMRLLTIHRLRSVFVVLNGCCLASLLRSISSLGVIFRDLSVLWRSFTLPVWFTHCFNRTMTKWLTLNSSAVFLVGHITPYHSNRLPSLCIWQFLTCHVEIKFRKFKLSPSLHV